MQGASGRSIAEARERLGEVLRAGGIDSVALGDELFEVVHLLDATLPLRRILSDASVAAERKSALLRSLIGGRTTGATVETVEDVAQRRWSRSIDLVDALEELAVISLVDKADREGRLDDVEDELFRFGRIVDANPDLRAAVTGRGIADEPKRELVRGLLAGKVSAETLRLVTELTLHPRGRTFERGLEEYGRLAAESRRRIVAFVRTARPLNDDQRARLTRALAATYRRDVTLNIDIDPEVLGGMVVQIGDEVIDGTVRSRLDEARRRFAA